MKNTPLTSRAALVSRSRKHFATFAASSIVMTGALAAYVAHDDQSGTSTGNHSSTSSGTTSSDSSGTSSNDSSISGITSSDSSRSSDGSSNAS